MPQLVSDFGAKLRLIAQHATDRATALKLGLCQEGGYTRCYCTHHDLS